MELERQRSNLHLAWLQKSDLGSNISSPVPASDGLRSLGSETSMWDLKPTDSILNSASSTVHLPLFLATSSELTDVEEILAGTTSTLEKASYLPSFILC